MSHQTVIEYFRQTQMNRWGRQMESYRWSSVVVDRKKISRLILCNEICKIMWQKNWKFRSKPSGKLKIQYCQKNFCFIFLTQVMVTIFLQLFFFFHIKTTDWNYIWAFYVIFFVDFRRKKIFFCNGSIRCYQSFWECRLLTTVFSSSFFFFKVQRQKFYRKLK